MRNRINTSNAELKAIRAQLVEAFPLIFFPKTTPYKVPLAIGIKRQIIESGKILGKDGKPIGGIVLSRGIKDYVKGVKYARSIMQFNHRFDLNGMPVHEIKAEHKAHAKRYLDSKTQLRQLEASTTT